MSRNTLSKIFDEFYQAHSSETRSYGGVGVGLYIAKKFAELPEEEIAVESTEAKRSTFVLIVPCNPETQLALRGRLNSCQRFERTTELRQ